MKTIVLFSSVIFLILIACNRQEKTESISPFAPKVVEAKGYVVPKDSMAEPKVVFAGKPRVVKAGNPEVVLTNTNVFPAGAPMVVMTSSPKILLLEKTPFYRERRVE